MKLTESRLKQMIKEEIQKINEQIYDPEIPFRRGKNPDYRSIAAGPDYASTYLPAGEGDVVGDTMSPVAGDEIAAMASNFKSALAKAERILKKSKLARIDARGETENIRAWAKYGIVDTLDVERAKMVLDFYEAARRMYQSVKLAGELFTNPGSRGSRRNLALNAANINRNFRQFDKLLAELENIVYRGGETYREFRPVYKQANIMRRTILGVERKIRELLKLAS